MAKKYGFEIADWEVAKEETRQVLIDRAAVEDTIPYSELVMQISSIDLEPDSFALAQMLGEISTAEDAAGRGMLSVIVVHKDGDRRPGPGFFQLAKKLVRDPRDRETCWVEELHWVYREWSAVKP
jgi:hypothetical protein